MKRLILLIFILLLYSIGYADVHKMDGASIDTTSKICGSTSDLSAVDGQSIASAATGGGSVGEINYDSSSSYQTTNPNFYYLISKTASGGAITHGHAYVGQHNGEEITLTLFSSTGVVLAYGSVTPTTDDYAWQHVTLNTSVNVTATTYLCGYTCSSAGRLYYTDPGDTDYDTQTYSSTPSNLSLPLTDLWDKTGTIIFNNSAGDPS